MATDRPQAGASGGAERAAQDVAAGRVGWSSRRVLGLVALVLAFAFAVDTWLIATMRLLPFDLPVALFIQRVPWGPQALAMDLTNAISGPWQTLLGVVVVVLLLALVDRRAGWLMAIGGVASL